MILQADVARFGALGLAFGFVPLFSRWQVGACRVESRDALTIEIDEDFIFVEGDDHRLPFTWLGSGGGGSQRINGAGAMPCISTARNLYFVATMHGQPRSFLALG